MLLVHEREQLVELGRRMRGDELTVGTSGNLSIRCGDLVAITPSGTAYETLTPEAICVIDLEGKRVDGRLVPSSEGPMHMLVYQRTPPFSLDESLMRRRRRLMAILFLVTKTVVDLWIWAHLR